jgi:hypothetical protein
MLPSYFVERGIQIGSTVHLHFAGGPSDMPKPWTVTRLGEKYSSVSGRCHPWIQVRASNGVYRVFEHAEFYSPRVVNA